MNFRTWYDKSLSKITKDGWLIGWSSRHANSS
jgi:hypothetical protein